MGPVGIPAGPVFVSLVVVVRSVSNLPPNAAKERAGGKRGSSFVLHI